VKNGKMRPFRIDERGLWFETQYGFFVYSSLNDRILGLDVNATWEQMESTFIVNNLSQGDVFVDVGANIGYFSMLAAQQGAGKVFAIEPIPKTYAMLCMNVEHNMFTGVIEPVNVALGSQEHTAKFTCSLGPKNHIEYDVDNIHHDLPTIDIKVTTLDHLLADRKEVNRIDFVKVDIEGAEYRFLLGAEKTIKAFKPIVMMEIEEHRLTKYNVTAENIFTFMNELGYKYLSVAEDSITQGDIHTEDLKRGRDFIFYTSNHNLTY
jgi:FkbM family methyltransferase